MCSSDLYYKWAFREASFDKAVEEMMKERYGLDSVPTFTQMQRNASLIFYGGHHAIDFARPLPPVFVPIGGMQCLEKIGALSKVRPVKSLSSQETDHNFICYTFQEFQEFMDNAEDGVTLIAFGSTVDLSTMPSRFLNLFFNMMRRFSTVRFIWRWKGEMPDNAPENLMAAEWLPQKEILSKFINNY